MYLSYLLINVGTNPDRPRPGRLWLRNLYHLHQRLSMAFPSSEQKNNDPLFLKPFSPTGFNHVHGERNLDQGFLFRVDPLPGPSAMIIVQSAILPDWEYAFQNTPFLTAKPEVKNFNPQFEVNQPLKFRLLANPVRKTSQKSLDARGNPLDKKWTGKRVPVPSNRIQEWLAKKAEKGGFQIEKLYLVQTGYIRIKGHRKDDESNRLFSVKYEGILKITNPDEFRKTLTKGIGPAKAFGFGLLTVAEIK